MRGSPSPRIRAAGAADAPAIADVTRAAYAGAPKGAPKGAEERTRLAPLGDDDLVIVALVAVEDGEIIGNILFSEREMTNLEHQGPIRAAVLASLAVAPTHQGLGIGSELVRQGLEKCRELGIEAIVVGGDGKFFARFGFSAQPSECLKSAISGQNVLSLALK